MQTQPVATPGPPPPFTNMTSLPDQAKGYTDSVLMKSERVTAKFFPQNNGTFGPNQATTIRFDVTSTMFLDLSRAQLVADFNMETLAATNNCILDGGLGGTISRISIMNAAGQLLERIDDYALLQTVLLQCSDRARTHADELWLSEGFIANSADPSLDLTSTGGITTTGQNNNVPSIRGSADDMYAIGSDAGVVTRQLSHRLHGAWFQTQRKKLLPPGIAFRVEIELVDSAHECLQSQTADASANFNLTNVFLNIPTVQIMSQGDPLDITIVLT